jgi:putative endonuclease
LSTGLVCTTVVHSPALKNTSNSDRVPFAQTLAGQKLASEIRKIESRKLPDSKKIEKSKVKSNLKSQLKSEKPSTAKPLYWAHQRGLVSEDRVRAYYQKKSYTLIEQRVKTPYAELDLLFRTPEGHLLIVEVKTANLSSFYNYKVTPRQKIRLLRAVQFLAERFATLVEIHWAFVTKEGEITIISDISG